MPHTLYYQVPFERREDVMQISKLRVNIVIITSQSRNELSSNLASIGNYHRCLSFNMYDSFSRLNLSLFSIYLRELHA